MKPNTINRKQLSENVEELKTQHENLRKIRTEFFNFSSEFSRSKNQKIHFSSFYASDATLAINQSSAVSLRDETDILEDSVSLSNCNCSSYNYSHNYNIYCGEENITMVTEETSLQTPYFILQHKKNKCNESIESSEELMEAVQMLLSFGVFQLCLKFEKECLHFIEWNCQLFFWCPFLDPPYQIFYYYHSIIMLDHIKEMKMLSQMIDGLKEEDTNSYHGLLTCNYVTMDHLKVLSLEEDNSMFVAERCEQENDFYCFLNSLVGNYLGVSNCKRKDFMPTSFINYSFSSCQLLNYKIELLLIEDLYINSNFIIKKVNLTSIIATTPKLNRLNTICRKEPSSLPKLINVAYKYTHHLWGKNRNKRTFCTNISYRGDKYHEKTWLSKSFLINSELKRRLITSSQKKWNKIIRKTLMVIFRKITSDLFRNKPSSQSIISNRTPPLERKIKSNSEKDFSLVIEKNLKEEDPFSLNPLEEEVIKLNSINLLEHRLCDLNMKDPRILQGKNIYEIKRAMKANIINDSEQALPSFFSKDFRKKPFEIKEDPFDSLNSNTIIEKLALYSDNYNIRSFPVGRYGEENILLSGKHKYKNLRDNKSEGFFNNKFKMNERCDSENTYNDLTASRWSSSSADQNRYFKTSKQKLDAQLLEENVNGNDNFELQTIRQKATACIINAKTHINVVDPRSTSQKVSTNIDKFFRNQDEVSDKTYRCIGCCKSYKFGAEFRQHLRSQICRQNLLVSNIPNNFL